MTVTSRTSQDEAQPRFVWPQPRQPLPPHRLAKLANALGVSTPLPATNPFPARISPLPSPSLSDANLMFRSPTPSGVSTHAVTASMTSRFLLHIVPPKDLAQAADESQYTPLPASASGYHSQYDRGTLVPLHQSLQGQLTAIAKEYALPSTIGLVLYLVSSTPSPNALNPAPNRDATLQEWENEEQGPRISEAIWRHIWIRVLKVEREDSASSSSRVGTPDVGYIASQSSPSLLDSTSMSSSLKPFTSANTLAISGYPIASSPTTPSSSGFDLNNRTRSRLRHAAARSLTTSIDRELSSSPALTEPSPNPDAVDLPGLHSNSFIPVLAKVEFVIDQARATWYEPWLRSRRLNHAKRAESRARGASFNNEVSEDDRRPPINLRLVDKAQAEADVPGFLRKNRDYLRLEDEDGDDDDDDASGGTKDGGYSHLDGDDDDELDHDEITAQFPPVPGARDPLADIFGTDADTWAVIRAESRPVRKSNPSVVDLALDGAALAEELPPEEDDTLQPNDEEEVKDLWEDQSRPRFSVTIPSSPPSPALDTSNRKSAPPPLNLSAVTPGSALNPLMILAGPLPSSGDESASLAYLKDGISLEGLFTTRQGEELTLEVTEADDEVARGPFQDKRDGAFFEGLDLGLSFGVDDTVNEIPQLSHLFLR